MTSITSAVSISSCFPARSPLPGQRSMPELGAKHGGEEEHRSRRTAPSSRRGRRIPCCLPDSPFASTPRPPARLGRHLPACVASSTPASPFCAWRPGGRHLPPSRGSPWLHQSTSTQGSHLRSAVRDGVLVAINLLLVGKASEPASCGNLPAHGCIDLESWPSLPSRSWQPLFLSCVCFFL